MRGRDESKCGELRLLYIRYLIGTNATTELLLDSLEGASAVPDWRQ
jgi:hypothetical protein